MKNLRRLHIGIALHNVGNFKLDEQQIRRISEKHHLEKLSLSNVKEM